MSAASGYQYFLGNGEDACLLSIFRNYVVRISHSHRASAEAFIKSFTAKMEAGRAAAEAAKKAVKGENFNAEQDKKHQLAKIAAIKKDSSAGFTKVEIHAASKACVEDSDFDFSEMEDDKDNASKKEVALEPPFKNRCVSHGSADPDEIELLWGDEKVPESVSSVQDTENLNWGRAEEPQCAEDSGESADDTPIGTVIEEFVDVDTICDSDAGSVCPLSSDSEEEIGVVRRTRNRLKFSQRGSGIIEVDDDAVSFSAEINEILLS